MYSAVVRLQILDLQDIFAPIILKQIDATAVALTEVLNIEPLAASSESTLEIVSSQCGTCWQYQVTCRHVICDDLACLLERGRF
jgi:hypothetical protein